MFADTRIGFIENCVTESECSLPSKRIFHLCNNTDRGINFSHQSSDHFFSSLS